MPLIAAKRDGGELERDDLFFLLSPVVSDEQLAAFLMAVVWHGMTERETEALLDAMIASGERLTWPWPVADKHSTGGVGDKATLVVAPLVAACGGRMAKMSGRGLGHTGGTLDKLESIPGFRTSLSVDEMREQVERVGVAVCGQTADLAPADARLYALRDMTATTHSLPLIATSVMSKKIASGRQPAGAGRQGRRGSVHARPPPRGGAGRTDGAAGRTRTGSRRRRWCPRWTSRSATPSATRWRSPRPWRRCGATGRPTCARWRWRRPPC